MLLEIHDTEEGNTLNGKVNNLDYDYMAEQWVQDLAAEQPECVRFILFDHLGERARWEKPGPGATSVSLVWKSDRFTGEWVLNHPFPLKPPRT